MVALVVFLVLGSNERHGGRNAHQNCRLRVDQYLLSCLHHVQDRFDDEISGSMIIIPKLLRVVLGVCIHNLLLRKSERRRIMEMETSCYIDNPNRTEFLSSVLNNFLVSSSGSSRAFGRHERDNICISESLHLRCHSSCSRFGIHLINTPAIRLRRCVNFSSSVGQSSACEKNEE